MHKTIRYRTTSSMPLQSVDWLLCAGFAPADHSICSLNSSNTELYNYTRPLRLYVHGYVYILSCMHAYNIPQCSWYVYTADFWHGLIDMVVDWKTIYHTTLHHGHTHPTPPHTRTTHYINTPHTIYTQSCVYCTYATRNTFTFCYLCYIHAAIPYIPALCYCARLDLHYATAIVSQQACSL